MSPRTVLLLVAHGSRAAGSTEAHADLCALVAARLGGDVRPAFLELAEPGIPEAIEAAVADGAERVVLLPHFLHRGNHTLRDIPETATAARARHPEVDIAVADPVGVHPGMVDLVCDLARLATS